MVATLVVAAACELVFALRQTPSPSGGGALLLVGLVAMLAAGGLVLAGVAPAGLYAPAAALFVTASFYTGDPYYGTTFRAYSDGGVVSPAWVFFLLGVAVVAGIATQLRERPGKILSATALVLLLFTALFMGTGH